MSVCSFALEVACQKNAEEIQRNVSKSSAVG